MNLVDRTAQLFVDSSTRTGVWRTLHGWSQYASQVKDVERVQRYRTVPTLFKLNQIPANTRNGYCLSQTRGMLASIKVPHEYAIQAPSCR